MRMNFRNLEREIKSSNVYPRLRPHGGKAYIDLNLLRYLDLVVFQFTFGRQLFEGLQFSVFWAGILNFNG